MVGESPSVFADRQSLTPGTVEHSTQKRAAHITDSLRLIREESYTPFSHSPIFRGKIRIRRDASNIRVRQTGILCSRFKDVSLLVGHFKDVLSVDLKDIKATRPC